MENVVALFNDSAQTKTALQALTQQGFPRDHLGFAHLDPIQQEEIARETGISHEGGVPAGSSAVLRGAGLGMLAGILLALPAWLLILLVPEARPLQEGGFIGVCFGAISGLGLGAAFGALSGGDHGDYIKLLDHLGVPPAVAAGYYRALKSGKIMVIAREQESARASEVAQILRSAGAFDLENRTELSNEGALSTERKLHDEGLRR